MALKQLAHKPPAPLPTAPTWGVVAVEAEAPSVLRLECADRTESLPYHTLMRWTHHLGADETLTIQTGSLVITVRGRELVPIREALDAGRLVSLRASEARYLAIKSGTVVTGIALTSDLA